jgi:hypothetical protein
MKNRPRIPFGHDVKPFTNTRMAGSIFVHSWSIRGWSLGAKVNALPARSPVRLQVNRAMLLAATGG